MEPFHGGTQGLCTAPVAVGYQFLNRGADQLGETTEALGNANISEAVKLFLRESEADYSRLRLEHWRRNLSFLSSLIVIGLRNRRQGRAR
jgi:hypothetical protein